MTMVLGPERPWSCSAQLEGGTTAFMAPELLVPSKYDFTASVPAQKLDIYAFALVIYQVLTGEVPFRGLRMGEIAVSVVEGKRPSKPENASDLGFSDSLWDFVERCWDGKLELRPNVTEVASQLSKAAAAWDGVMAPHALIENVVAETPEPMSGSMELCNIFPPSRDAIAILQSPTDSTYSAFSDQLISPSTQFTESPLEEPEEVVKKPW